MKSSKKQKLFTKKDILLEPAAAKQRKTERAVIDARMLTEGEFADLIVYVNKKKLEAVAKQTAVRLPALWSERGYQQHLPLFLKTGYIGLKMRRITKNSKAFSNYGIENEAARVITLANLFPKASFMGREALEKIEREGIGEATVKNIIDIAMAVNADYIVARTPYPEAQGLLKKVGFRNPKSTEFRSQERFVIDLRRLKERKHLKTRASE